jgi:hypothetical protein
VPPLAVLPLAALPLPGSVLLACVARLPDDVIREHFIPFLGCGFESLEDEAEERDSDIADVKRQIARMQERLDKLERTKSQRDRAKYLL